MSKPADTKEKGRHLIPLLLARRYRKDYEVAVAAFPRDKRVELAEHLLECLDIIESYISNPTAENWKIYAQKENLFLKKHGKRLKIYRQKNMYLYYGDNAVLIEKEIYTTKEWNALDSEQQKLSKEEFTTFIRICRSILFNERDLLLLEQNPEDETEEKNTKDPLNGAASQPLKRFNVKREAQDKLTCLSQEQTVLLMYYLQQERVFLKDEYLKDMDAGKAFEILTGYSQHTLRQNLGKFYLFQNKQNLKEIDHILTRLKIAIDRALKEK
jgi:hypothetical protein